MILGSRITNLLPAIFEEFYEEDFFVHEYSGMQKPLCLIGNSGVLPASNHLKELVVCSG